MEGTLYTMGIDIGGSIVKGAVLGCNSRGAEILATYHEKIYKRDPIEVAKGVSETLLDLAGMKRNDISYVATTGEGEGYPDKDGHFFSMTCHGRGALFLEPATRMVIDLGAFYIKAMKIDKYGRVVESRMTSQCASGSGQFVENIARYMGYAVEEVGDISLRSKNPQMPSGICAVLSETDVINMISRKVPVEDILMGINMSVANRAAKLISTIKPEFPIFLSGGMALNKGLVLALTNELKKKYPGADIRAHKLSIYCGAIGAALWGHLRYLYLKQQTKNDKSKTEVL